MKEAGKWKPILFACFIFAYATNPKILILSLTVTPKEVESALRQTSILMICLASLSNVTQVVHITTQYPLTFKIRSAKLIFMEKIALSRDFFTS